MEEQKIKEVVSKYYSKGFHCAEVIVSSFQELFPSVPKQSCRVASGFCGGIGKCRLDVCGALSGAVISLGNALGRENGGDDINKLVYLSAELRQAFFDEFRSTVCKDVIANINGRDEYENCQDVTARTAIMLCNLFVENTN